MVNTITYNIYELLNYFHTRSPDQPESPNPSKNCRSKSLPNVQKNTQSNVNSLHLKYQKSKHSSSYHQEFTHHSPGPHGQEATTNSGKCFLQTSYKATFLQHGTSACQCTLACDQKHDINEKNTNPLLTPPSNNPPTTTNTTHSQDIFTITVDINRGTVRCNSAEYRE